MFYIREDVALQLGDGADFDAIMRMSGKIYRDLCNRRTFSTEIGGRVYFVKLHTGVGWKEIFKNLSRFKLPIISAENEWQAISRLHQLQVPTMQVAAFGKRGSNPARVQSFVMTDALVNTESLEQFCPRYFAGRLCRRKLELKRALICKVAWIARQLHENRLIHSDLYICHFHIDLSPGEHQLTPDNLELYLIDLHRVRFSPVNFRRWVIKDLAAIYFSCLALPLDETDLLRFIGHYRQAPPREVLTREGRLWRKVERRAFKLYRKIHGEEPPDARRFLHRNEK